jgi:hypothetical protein
MSNHSLKHLNKNMKNLTLLLGGNMLRTLFKTLNKPLRTLAHTLDVLSKRVGKHVAETLVIFIALALVVETLWLTLVFTACILWYLLAH